MNLQRFTNAMLKYQAICPFGAPDFKNMHVASFWYDHLGKYSVEELGVAFGKLVTSGKFPSIDAVKEACGDVKEDPDALARELSARLREAITRFGQPNGEAAKEWLGDLGWRMVRLCGGWFSLCDCNSYDELAIVLAQGREAMKPVIARGINGGDMDSVPKLAAPTDGPHGDMIKKLAESTDLDRKLDRGHVSRGTTKTLVSTNPSK